MNASSADLILNGLHIELRVSQVPKGGYMASPFDFDLLNSALVTLITEMETEEVADEYDYAGHYFFWSSMLKAVAQHYVNSGPPSEVRRVSVQKVLHEMIDFLLRNGHLTETLTNSGDIDNPLAYLFN